MKCPVDDTDLSISSREGIEIDFCPRCRGVWLDRGELDKIIERAAVVPAPEPVGRSSSRDYDRDRDRDRDRDDRDRRYDDRRYDDRGHGDDRYGKKKKKRSFLEDIFEFGGD